MTVEEFLKKIDEKFDKLEKANERLESSFNAYVAQHAGEDENQDPAGEGGEGENKKKGGENKKKEDEVDAEEAFFNWFDDSRKEEK